MLPGGRAGETERRERHGERESLRMRGLVGVIRPCRVVLDLDGDSVVPNFRIGIRQRVWSSLELISCRGVLLNVQPGGYLRWRRKSVVELALGRQVTIRGDRVVRSLQDIDESIYVSLVVVQSYGVLIRARRA